MVLVDEYFRSAIIPMSKICRNASYWWMIAWANFETRTDGSGSFSLLLSPEKPWSIVEISTASLDLKHMLHTQRSRCPASWQRMTLRYQIGFSLDWLDKVTKANNMYLEERRAGGCEVLWTSWRGMWTSPCLQLPVAFSVLPLESLKRLLCA